MNAMTPAAQVLISLIPIIGIVFVATITFFSILWKHRENMLRIRCDNYTPFQLNTKAITLLSGMVLIGVGLVLTVLFILLEPISWSLLGGLIPLALGICLLIFYKIAPDQNNGDEK